MTSVDNLTTTTEPEYDEPRAVYSKKPYQLYVQETYGIENKKILYNDGILLLIYAGEWFKIPETDLVNKIRFHPYLTEKDYTLLTNIKNNHNLYLFLYTNAAFGLFYYLTIATTKISSVNKLIRFSKCLFLSLTTSFLFNKLYYKKRYENIIKNSYLYDKYFTLDLDKLKIKDDLLKVGIKI